MEKSPVAPQKKWFVVIPLILFCVWILASWYATDKFVDWEANRSLATIDQQAVATLKAYNDSIKETFALVQAIPDFLAQNYDIRKALQVALASPRKGNSEELRSFYETNPLFANVGKTFARYSKTIDVIDAIWLMLPDGTAIASSNAGEVNNFIGRNFSFRDYFQSAMKGQPEIQYAVGTVSNLDGLYFSSPVRDSKGKIIGVVVCKIHLSHLSNWLHQSDGLLIDRWGVVIKAEHKPFEMMALENAPVFSMSEERRMQIYKRNTFETLKITRWGENIHERVSRIGDSPRPYHLLGTDLSYGMKLFIANEMPFIAQQDERHHTFFLICTLLGGILLIIFSMLAWRLWLWHFGKREEIIHEMQSVDGLTGAYSRSIASALIQNGINTAARNRKNFAIVSLDLDDFKSVNETFGHESGDEIIKEVVRRIQATLRKSDIVIRYAGDEFIIVLQDIADRWTAAHVSLKIQNAIRMRHFVVNTLPVRISTSIGIAMYPDDGKTPEELLGNSEAALYHVKEKGRDNYAFFHPQMASNITARKMLEVEMEKALDKREFYLVYQPKYSFDNARITGCEALLRWTHPERGHVSPAEFIPVAEHSGLIIELGKWVLNEAARQANAWRNELGADIPVAVNLSSMQFRRSDILDTVTNALEANMLPPALMELELTESMIMEDTAYTSEIITALKKLGVKLAIDDFGTGYSSLAYLKKFDVDVIKIDREFVSDMENSADDQAIVKAVIHMAQSIDYQIVAEGVETAFQMDFLNKLGCHTIQGYHFSRPLSPEDFAAFWKKQMAEEAEKGSETV